MFVPSPLYALEGEEGKGAVCLGHLWPFLQLVPFFSLQSKHPRHSNASFSQLVPTSLCSSHLNICSAKTTQQMSLLDGAKAGPSRPASCIAQGQQEAPGKPHVHGEKAEVLPHNFLPFSKVIQRHDKTSGEPAIMANTH